MKIAVYGASGMIGSRVVAEALGRRHDVIGITRSGGPLPVGVRAVQGDAGDAEFARRIADSGSERLENPHPGNTESHAMGELK